MKFASTPDCRESTGFLEYLEDIPQLADILKRSSRHHRHICPRQVLGARIGMAGLEALGIPLIPEKKELLVISETDGCFLSGLEAATDVSVNHRTMRIADFGKIAATFVHVASEKAVRVSPVQDIRNRAWAFARPGVDRHYFAMLTGYQNIPTEDMLRFTPVSLTKPAASLISRPGIRTVCSRCGEEVINEREVVHSGETLCVPCAGVRRYYDPS